MQSIIAFISAHPLPSYAALAVLILLLIVELVRAQQKSANISVQQAIQLINQQHGVVFDLRAKEQFQQGHVINAQTFQVNELKNTPKRFEKFKNTPMIIMCASGLESRKVATTLAKQGYTAYAVGGGIKAWTSANMPLVKE
jgi:rhodanese-related sulfurtransferase